MSRTFPNLRIQGSGSRIFQAALGSPALGAVADIHAAVTDDATQQVITTGLTNPDVPRVVSATAGGTAADIKAIQVIVEGTNDDGVVITETLPVFTVNSAGTVTGLKAFKTVTKITIPAHDGTGATTSVGSGAALGMPYALSKDTIVAAFLNGVYETTRPTVKVSTAVENTTVSLNSALDGNAVQVDFYEPAT